MSSNGLENKHFGIPPGVSLSVIQIELPTGRRAVLVMPADMTSKEIRHFRKELRDFIDLGLDPSYTDALALERDDPASVMRVEPWEKP